MSNNPFTTVELIGCIVTGAVMIVAPSWLAARNKAAHERAIADRLARGSDMYFEELRTLQTYTPMKRIGAIRVVGTLLVAIGVLYFYL